MKIQIEVSEVQFAAIQTVAKTLRMTPEDATKVLAFVTIGTDFGELPDFREIVEDAAVDVLAGNLPGIEREALAGCIEFAEPAAAPAR